MASRRNYLSQAELADFADITINDTTEADDQISQAEELVDSYVGAQDKFLNYEVEGKAQSGTTTSFVLDSNHQNNYPYADFFAGCMVEIIGGTNAGSRKRCTASNTTGTLTTEAFTSALDNTSVYRIFQIGKFPRKKDVFYNSNETPVKYYKSIPEAVKRAVAAQVQFVIEMGSKYFATNASLLESESIGDYSYSKGSSNDNGTPLIAPKAKMLLKGIVNRTGRIIVDE